MTYTAQSLLDFMLNLFRDPEAQAAFEADPQGYLEECGFEDVTPEDLYDVLPLVLENTVQANTTQALDNSSTVTGGDVNINTGGAIPPLPQPEPGDSSLETVVKQIQHVTNNYTIDQTTTNVDNSLNQNIDNRGGVFDQTIDNDPVTAIGDGAQAAGDDLTNVEGEGNIVAGDDLDINDSNVVTGDVTDSVLADDITNSNVAAGDRAAAGQGNITGDVSGDGNVVGTGNTAQIGDGSAFGDGSAVQSGEGNVAGVDNVGVTGDNAAAAFGEGSQAVGGEGNQVVGGQGNTAAFGEGNATSATAFGGGDANAANLEGVSVDDGGALSVGGNASGFNEETEINITDSEDVNVATDDSTATQIGDLEVDVNQSTEIINSDNVAVDQDADADGIV